MIAAAVDVVLLAGGLSERFGTSKAATHWRGRSLAARVLDARPTGSGRTVLVLRAEGDPEPAAADAVVWDDPALPPGPVRGVIAGLRACTADRAWVLACDLPGLQTAVLELLRDEYRPGDDVVLPEWGGRLQPLCALYAVTAADGLAAALADGERSLIGAVERLKVRRPARGRVEAADPEGLSFVNVNRPADLDRLDERQEMKS